MAIYKQEMYESDMTNKNIRWVGLCALVAVLTAGCHKPTYDQLQPRTVKWSLSVVAQAESDQQKKNVESILAEAAKGRPMTTQAQWAAPAQALPAVAAAVKQKADLIVTDAKGIDSVAKQHSEVRFAVVGDSTAPTLPNVRHVALDPKQRYFLAGFLAAEANRQSAEPFTVLVDHAYAADDPDWQMIIAGCRAAGRKDVPAQVQASAFAAPPTGQETGKKTVLTTPRLSGQTLLLLTNLPDAAWTKAKARGMVLIRTDDSLQPIAQQASVLAQPSSLLEEALREEASLLTSGKWQGEQAVKVQGKHPFKIVNGGLVPDKDLQMRFELMEDQLAAGSITPDSYLSAK